MIVMSNPHNHTFRMCSFFYACAVQQMNAAVSNDLLRKVWGGFDLHIPGKLDFFPEDTEL